MENSQTVVLIVDDDQIVLNFLTAALQERGYRVLLAASAEQALTVARADTDDIHVLLSDVNMPGMSGLELADQLLQERPGIRVLMMSGRDPAEIGNFTLPFLSKPIDLDELWRKLDYVLSQPATRRAGS